MTPFFAPELASTYQAAQQGEFLKLVCACGQRPCGAIQLGRMTIQSKHKVLRLGSQVHSNTLTLEDIAEIYESIGGIIAGDSRAQPD